MQIAFHNFDLGQLEIIDDWLLDTHTHVAIKID